MDRDFWHQRWLLNQIGFHSDEVNPYLEKYWPRLAANPDDSVLVPLCGKSRDLLWLLARGNPVIGVEISPIAVNAFFAENGLEPVVSQSHGFCVNEIDGLQIWCGDYFALPEKSFDNINRVYDRAALVALPFEMRKGYAAKFKGLLKSGTQILLISLEYEQSEMAGPPFRVDREEIERLYGDWCDIECLEVQDILSREPQFKAKGISKMEELVYLLTLL